MPFTFNPPSDAKRVCFQQIQACGILLAIHSASLEIEQISSNSSAILGQACENLLHRPVTGLVPEIAREKFRMLLQQDTKLSTYFFTFGFECPSEGLLRCHCQVTHLNHEVILLEIEPLVENIAKFSTLPNASHLIESAREFYSTLDDPEVAVQHLVDEVRDLTGFDRVLVYRFQPGLEGEVVAESRDVGVPSLLHLHFPADESSARTVAFHLRHRIHAVQDTTAPACHLIPGEHPRLDTATILNNTSLQGIPPEGLEALRRIGVQSSMTVALTVEGNLWGLIVCHHREPRYIRHEIRSTIGLLAMLVAPELNRIEILRSKIIQSLKEQELALLLANVAPFESLEQMLQGSLPAIASVFGADGVAFRDQDKIHRFGSVPDIEVIEALSQTLENNKASPKTTIVSGAKLESSFQSGLPSSFTGLISIPFGHESWLLIFREQIEESLQWERDPNDFPIRTVSRVGASGNGSETHIGDQTWDSSWPPFTGYLVDELRAGLSGLLISTNRELSSVNEELRHFANVIAHEVKSQLHMPLMALSVIQEQDRNSALNPMIDLGINALKTLSEFTSGMLGFAHSDFNVGEVEMVNLHEIASQTLEQARQSVNPEHFDFEIKELPMIRASRSQIHHILLNLLRNSLLHAPFPGQVDLKVVVGSLGDGASPIIYVRDNGRGIPAEEQDRIFEYFYRAKGAGDRTGSGIGLAFIKRLLERTGGQLWVESEPGKGSTFFCTLSGGKDQRVSPSPAPAP